MTKLAPEWVRTSDPVIRSPAHYRWTTAPARATSCNLSGERSSQSKIGQGKNSTWGRTLGAGHLGQDTWGRTLGAGHMGQDTWGRTLGAGHLGQDTWAG